MDPNVPQMFPQTRQPNPEVIAKMMSALKPSDPLEPYSRVIELVSEELARVHQSYQIFARSGTPTTDCWANKRIDELSKQFDVLVQEFRSKVAELSVKSS
jgi:hypothetical protein